MHEKFLELSKVWYSDNNYTYPAIVWENHNEYTVIYKYALGMWTRKVVNAKTIKKRKQTLNSNIYYYRKKTLNEQ